MTAVVDGSSVVLETADVDVGSGSGVAVASGSEDEVGSTDVMVSSTEVIGAVSVDDGLVSSTVETLSETTAVVSGDSVEVETTMVSNVELEIEVEETEVMERDVPQRPRLRCLLGAAPPS